MEAEKRVLRSRKPLSNCTNVNYLTPASSHSSSSSAFKKCKSATATATTTPSSRNSRICGTSDPEVSEPISVIYSRRNTSEKRKNKKKAVANEIPFSSTPMAEILNILENREKSNQIEVVDLPERSTFPCRKKQRSMPPEQDVFDHALLEDFINKQKAYFDEIDEFKLPVEEVDTIKELE